MVKALWLLLISVTFAALHAEPLVELRGCTLIETDWADGDSFRIKTADGDEHTIRLYGADCPELIIESEADRRRITSQQRYFGLHGKSLKLADPDKIVQQFGEKAKAYTVAFLQRPFTVHTSYADAMGDPRFKRIYGFVIDQDGKDLAKHLVSSGLARAHGVYRSTHDRKSKSDYQDLLKDHEMFASKHGIGIWKLTDWSKILEERLSHRHQERQIRQAIGELPLDADFRVNINKASKDSLMKLPGIGEVIALRIIEHRPYKNQQELLKVPGIGSGIFEAIRPYLIELK